MSLSERMSQFCAPPVQSSQAYVCCSSAPLFFYTSVTVTVSVLCYLCVSKFAHARTHTHTHHYIILFSVGFYVVVINARVSRSGNTCFGDVQELLGVPGVIQVQGAVVISFCAWYIIYRLSVIILGL